MTTYLRLDEGYALGVLLAWSYAGPTPVDTGQRGVEPVELAERVWGVPVTQLSQSGPRSKPKRRTAAMWRRHVGVPTAETSTGNGQHLAMPCSLASFVGKRRGELLVAQEWVSTARRRSAGSPYDAPAEVIEHLGGLGASAGKWGSVCASGYASRCGSVKTGPDYWRVQRGRG